MSSKKNVPASVRQRLLNRARNDKRPFSELLQYYAMERFLYRLSKSPHGMRFILKGALMLRAWRSPQFRPTMDIDMLGRTSNEESRILSQIRSVLSQSAEPDGIFFDLNSLRAEKITEDADYTGIRILFQGTLDTAKVRMQLDIGFGDIIYPQPVKTTLPAMLDFPPPTLLCYSLESAIAEKFEAMVKFGIVNSRLKDFYDIWLLSRQFNFESRKLARAIQLTLEQRKTDLPPDITAFEEPFIRAKQGPWTAFRKRLNQDHLPASFFEIVFTVRNFLEPVLTKTPSETSIDDMVWVAPGPWSSEAAPQKDVDISKNTENI